MEILLDELFGWRLAYVVLFFTSQFVDYSVDVLEIFAWFAWSFGHFHLCHLQQFLFVNRSLFLCWCSLCVGCCCERAASKVCGCLNIGVPGLAGGISFQQSSRRWSFGARHRWSTSWPLALHLVISPLLDELLPFHDIVRPHPKHGQFDSVEHDSLFEKLNFFIA